MIIFGSKKQVKLEYLVIIHNSYLKEKGGYEKI